MTIIDYVQKVVNNPNYTVFSGNSFTIRFYQNNDLNIKIYPKEVIFSFFEPIEHTRILSIEINPREIEDEDGNCFEEGVYTDTDFEGCYFDFTELTEEDEEELFTIAEQLIKEYYN